MWVVNTIQDKALQNTVLAHGLISSQVEAVFYRLKEILFHLIHL